MAFLLALIITPPSIKALLLIPARLAKSYTSLAYVVQCWRWLVVRSRWALQWHFQRVERPAGTRTMGRNLCVSEMQVCQDCVSVRGQVVNICDFGGKLRTIVILGAGCEQMWFWEQVVNICDFGSRLWTNVNLHDQRCMQNTNGKRSRWDGLTILHTHPKSCGLVGGSTTVKILQWHESTRTRTEGEVQHKPAHCMQ
jgi:hypothetical protein